jgi:hypothetical protein
VNTYVNERWTRTQNATTAVVTAVSGMGFVPLDKKFSKKTKKVLARGFLFAILLFTN